MLKKLKNKFQKAIMPVKLGITTGIATSLATINACAEGATELNFSFDPGQMFKWTNVMLSALMPVLYITLGLSLAFMIVGALKAAFR